jgi:iron complex transport system ATP-binding protein
MILKAESIDFSYRSRGVLERISFEIKAGEITAILGPNGAGKTTLLKTVNGLLKPKGGTVFLSGRDLTTIPPRDIARTTAYVAQRNDPVRMTVFDSVLLGRKPHINLRVTDKDLTVTQKAISMLGLDSLILRYTDELSGGEFQKVCIARALAQEPELILLDEPTSSLDLFNQIEILTILHRIIASMGTGVLMTIHDLNTAFRYADRLIFLRNGSVYCIIPKEEINPEIIQAVYNVQVEIHYQGGHPYMVPLDIHHSESVDAATIFV